MKRSTRSPAARQPAPPAPARILTFPDFQIAATVLANARGNLAFARTSGIHPLRRTMALEEADREVARVVDLMLPFMRHPRCSALYREARHVGAEIAGAMMAEHVEASPVVEVPRPVVTWAYRVANRNAATG